MARSDHIGRHTFVFRNVQNLIDRLGETHAVLLCGDLRRTGSGVRREREGREEETQRDENGREVQAQSDRDDRFRASESWRAKATSLRIGVAL